MRLRSRCKMLELVGVEGEVCAAAFRNIGTAFGGLGESRSEKRAQQMRWCFAEFAFRQIDDQHLAPIHDAAYVDGALGLAEDVA